jgi:CRP/FNR family transcriptional regulator, cyclic AMP receptor protein
MFCRGKPSSRGKGSYSPPVSSNDQLIDIFVSVLADRTTFERSLSALPLVTYQAGETVIADGSRTGRLLILRKGAVAIVLDQPHTADVIALEAWQFHVAEAASLLAHNPIAVLDVATVLAHRLDGANHALVQLKGANPARIACGRSSIVRSMNELEERNVRNVSWVPPIHDLRADHTFCCITPVRWIDAPPPLDDMRLSKCL